MAHSGSILHELNPPMNECSPRLTEIQVKVEAATAMACGKTAYKGNSPAPIAVVRRNARERNRVKQLNNGYATLRSHIPPSVAAAWADGGSDSSTNSNSRKLSKVETLRLAVEYIKTLQDLLTSAGNENHEPLSNSNSSIDPNSVLIDMTGEHHQLHQIHQHVHSPCNSSQMDSMDMVKVENVDTENAFDCTDWWTDDVPLT